MLGVINCVREACCQRKLCAFLSGEAYLERALQALLLAIMLGPTATIPDITLLDLSQVVPAEDDQPDVGSSSLSPDSLGEEEELTLVDPYRIKTTCHGCEKTLRFIVVSGETSLRQFQGLLLTDLSFLCPTCVAVHLKIKNGRR